MQTPDEPHNWQNILQLLALAYFKMQFALCKNVYTIFVVYLGALKIKLIDVTNFHTI